MACSKVRERLKKIRLRLRTGKTLGENPRPLRPEEVAALTEGRDRLLEIQRTTYLGRLAARPAAPPVAPPAAPPAAPPIHLCQASEHPQAKGQHLYIMGTSIDPGILKIGRSSDPHKRAIDLQGGTWFKVKVMAVFADCGDREKLAHTSLADLRIGNSEWFRASFAEAVGAINKVL